MRVKMLVEMRVKLNSISTKIYRLGETYDVDNEVALSWIEDSAAEQVGEITAPAFTVDERLVLKQAAGEMLNQPLIVPLSELSHEQLIEAGLANGIENAVEMDADDLFGVLEGMIAAQNSETVSEEDDNDETEIVLEDLDYDELVEVATKLGVDKPRGMKKEALLATLQELKIAKDAADSEDTAD